MLSRVLLLESGRLECTFDDSTGLIVHGAAATHFSASGDRQRFLLECAPVAIRDKLVAACEIGNRYLATPCGPYLRFVVSEGKHTTAHYNKITRARWKKNGSSLVSEDTWAYLDVHSDRVDVRWRCYVPKDREVVKSRTEHGTVRVDIMYRHVDLEQFFPRRWLPEYWMTDLSSEVSVAKLPVPSEPEPIWEDDGISPVGLYCCAKNGLEVVWVPQGTVWAKENVFIAWPHDETTLVSETLGQYWTHSDASGDVIRHMTLPEGSFLDQAVTLFRRCPKRASVVLAAPTPARVFDTEVVVPHVGRFTIYKCGDKEIVRAAFVDDARAEYIVGESTFTFTSHEGRSQRTFAVPGNAEQHAQALAKFPLRPEKLEEKDAAMRNIAEAELRRIETLRLKQMTAKLRTNEMLQALDKSRQRCAALIAEKS